MAQIVLSKKAGKYLKRMDERLKSQLITKLEGLASAPAEAAGVKPMEGENEGCHRLRHGDLRVIYHWDKEVDVIVVLAIGPRGDIYK
jgi:mRNA interferase RelE/StbE